MKKNRLHRRTFLRGAGGIAIALPWLEIMGEPARAAGAGEEAKRFVAVYTPGGTVLDRWIPRDNGDGGFDLSPILSPLEEIRHKLAVVSGLSMRSARGEQHQAGIIAWLTGTNQSDAHRRFAAGPSIDQVIAGLVQGERPHRSLEFAVRWATGSSNGLLHPINVANFEDNDEFSPIPPRLDPVEIFSSLFGGDDPSETERRIAQKRSILDFVGGRYRDLGARLGVADRAKLDQHLTKLRELEGTLEELALTDRCQVPMEVDTSDYDPSIGSTGGLGGTDAAIPKVGRYMSDMLVMAMACELTAVGSLQWTDTEAKHTFPWLDLSEHHHYYQHDGGFRPNECERIYTWYAEQHAHLLSSMDAVDMGGHTLLDESVVYFGSELQSPPSHSKDDMPFLLGGCGGGLQSGWLRYDGESHNDLLVSILNLFGDERTTFGDAEFCDGPLGGLTA